MLFSNDLNTTSSHVCETGSIVRLDRNDEIPVAHMFPSIGTRNLHVKTVQTIQGFHAIVSLIKILDLQRCWKGMPKMEYRGKTRSFLVLQTPKDRAPFCL